MADDKYPLPDFLIGHVEDSDFKKWLNRKALAHIQRDRERGNTTETRESYKIAIHKAIMVSRGKDAYTGRDLAWELIGDYDNEMSQQLGREYRIQFRYLPTIDHVDDGLGAPNFKVCGLQTNDSKSCLTHEEFVDFCREVIRHSNPPA